MPEYVDDNPIDSTPRKGLLKALRVHREMRVREAVGDREPPVGCPHNIADCWYIDPKTDQARCHECDRKRF
jgi:hypothetical protein